jgi:hypothetical protein
MPSIESLTVVAGAVKWPRAGVLIPAKHYALMLAVVKAAKEMSKATRSSLDSDMDDLGEALAALEAAP